jgi:hypothetical protein
MTPLFRSICLIGLAGAALLAQAQGFSALISPPRVETGVKAGKTTRQVLEITQVGPLPGHFRVYTSDWSLNAQGGVDFFDKIQPGSCRPWVALERRELTVAGNSKLRFRMEITPPADAPATECRFAVMFEGLDTSTVASNVLSFPVSGRIGVIVYAAMEGTQAELRIIGQGIGSEAAKLPTLQVRNTGTAHGRAAGVLTGTDAKGTKLEFTPTTLPILPGETRAISLSANVEGATTLSPIAYPVTIKGVLELSGQRVPFEHTFKE